MNNDMRIALAEFMGWTEIKEVRDADLCGLSPRSKGGYWPSAAVALPDPRNDANDCEALIRKLVADGWNYERQSGLGGPEDYVAFRKHGRNLDWWGDDYKHGVCDLAEKIIEQQEDGDALVK